MTASKKAKKAIKVQKVVKVNSIDTELTGSAGLVLGFVSIALALVSLLGQSTALSILALVIGSIAIWLSVRNGHYQVLFGGVAGLLIALVGILNMTNGLY